MNHHAKVKSKKKMAGISGSSIPGVGAREDRVTSPQMTGSHSLSSEELADPSLM